MILFYYVRNIPAGVDFDPFAFITKMFLRVIQVLDIQRRSHGCCQSCCYIYWRRHRYFWIAYIKNNDFCYIIFNLLMTYIIYFC